MALFVSAMAAGLVSPLASQAQTGDAARISRPTDRGPAKGRRIIILGTTIVGSPTKPRVVYEVPWREPESLRKDLDVPQRSFQDEIFLFLDKEEFESEGR